MALDVTDLDLAPAGRWYYHNRTILDDRIWRRFAAHSARWPRLRPTLCGLYQLAGQLVGDDMRRVITLFPDPSQDRSCLVRITGTGAHWFDGIALAAGNLQATAVRRRAAFESAIIPSWYEIRVRQGNQVLRCTIKLCRIPPLQLPGIGDLRTVTRIILVQGLVHEIAHSIVAPLWGNRYQIRMGGKWLSGEESMLHFGHLVQRLGVPPISHYSSAYWRGQELIYDPTTHPREARTQIPLQEELVETIAAAILGFSFCDEIPGREGQGLEPLRDRPTVARWIHTFLRAPSRPS